MRTADCKPFAGKTRSFFDSLKRPIGMAGGAFLPGEGGMCGALISGRGADPVSYTHLTLPTDAGRLEYLRGRTFQVQRVPFAEKYFPDFKLS